jgi:hypothetical protein
VLLSFAFLNLNKNGQQDCNSNVGEFLVRHRKEGECQNNSGKKSRRQRRRESSPFCFVFLGWFFGVAKLWRKHALIIKKGNMK